MRHGISVGLAGLAVAAMAGAASGQATSIGPFTGDSSEDFSGKSSAFHPCIPERVFDGRADLCANSAHVTGGWGFRCTIRPFTGGSLYGSTGSPSTYTFDAPVAKFGGYFGTNAGEGGNGTADFYDENGVLIESLQVEYRDDCNWYWNGWEFATPVKSITLTNNDPFGGGFMQHDGMELEWDGGGTGCYPDCDGNTVLDFFDFLCFQNAFLAQDPYADCDQNQVLDFFDFLCFQNEFLAGCP